MTATTVAPIDHAALDAILSRLEQQYGHEPRLDRAFRLFMAGRVEILADEPPTALVHGDSGTSYHASICGWCECVDHENGNLCKHRFGVMIAIQMATVARAKQAARDLRAQYERLCFERSALGARICRQGRRPIDDPLFVEYGESIAAVRAQMAAAR